MANALWFSIYWVKWVVDRVRSLDLSAGNSQTASQSLWPNTYTSWCFLLQPVYFMLASTTSAFHLTTGRSPAALRVLQWTSLELCLPSAWLVTMVVFTMLNPLRISIAYDNVAHMHFYNTAAFTVEFSLNRLPVRAGHAILMIVYVLAYVRARTSIERAQEPESDPVSPGWGDSPRLIAVVSRAPGCIFMDHEVILMVPFLVLVYVARQCARALVVPNPRRTAHSHLFRHCCLLEAQRGPP